MKRIINLALLLLIIAQLSDFCLRRTGSAAAERSATTKVESEWLRVSPANEEFSMLAPVQPSLLIIKPDGYISNGGGQVSDERAYSGYADDFVFVIESYRTPRPQQLLSDMKDEFSQFGLAEEYRANGFVGRKYKVERNGLFKYVCTLVTVKHVYVITAAARDANHPFIARFLSALKIGDKNLPAGDVDPRMQEASLATLPNQAIGLSSKEISQNAVLVWKPEPSYTLDGRKNRTIGVVILKVLFPASGQIVVLEVVKGLKDGLTAQAIQAAKNLRFFPARKDGRPVTLQTQLEYTFNLY